MRSGAGQAVELRVVRGADRSAQIGLRGLRTGFHEAAGGLCQVMRVHGQALSKGGSVGTIYYCCGLKRGTRAPRRTSRSGRRPPAPAVSPRQLPIAAAKPPRRRPAARVRWFRHGKAHRQSRHPTSASAGGCPATPAAAPPCGRQAWGRRRRSTLRCPLHRHRVALAEAGFGDEVDAGVAGAVLGVLPHLLDDFREHTQVASPLN